jgi:hypothetical protein
MKYVLLFLSLLCGTRALCQVQVTGTIVDKETGKPIPELYFYVHKNYDKWIDFSQTNSQGNFTGKIRADELDSTAKYQIFINDRRYKLTAIEINIRNINPIFIQLTRRKNSTNLDASTPSFGLYAPQVVDSIKELPDAIQKNLSTYLKGRLGPRFYSRTQLAGGRVVNIARLHKVEPNSLNYRWTVHNYYLCFAIDTLNASIAMDSTGRVTEELYFQDIGKDSSKAKVITGKQAIKIAKQNKAFHKKTTTIFFGYNKVNDCFEWIVRNDMDKGLNISTSILRIAAHTGQVLKISRGVRKRSSF